MFSWGENSRDGFGLVKSNGLVKANTDNCLNVILTKSSIAHLSAGNKVVAFIRSNGKVSFACRMHEYKDGKRVTWKLSTFPISFPATPYIEKRVPKGFISWTHRNNLLFPSPLRPLPNSPGQILV